MKKFILYISLTALWVFVQGQGNNMRTFAGSWINTNVTDFYESTKNIHCDFKYFDNDEFVPLYLSFENENEVKITYRIEQRIFTYKVIHSTPDSISISGGKNIYKIYFENNLLKFQYNENLITFRKASNKYSIYVFAEYIKGIIFRNHKTYMVTSFKENNNHNKMLVSKDDFEQKLRDIFGCEHVEIVQLGTFKYEPYCLPEIALYDSAKNKLGALTRTLGVLISEDNVQFVDNSGAIIVELKPN